MKLVLSITPILVSLLALAVSITVFLLQRRRECEVRNYQSELQFTEWFRHVNRALIDYPELWQLYSNNDTSFGRDVEIRLSAMVFMQLNMYAAVSAHYGYGKCKLTASDRQQWEAWRRTILSLLFESRMARSVWQSNFARRHYDKRFIELIDGLLATAEASRKGEGPDSNERELP